MPELAPVIQAVRFFIGNLLILSLIYFVILCITMLKIYSIMIAYTQTVVKARLERYGQDIW